MTRQLLLLTGAFVLLTATAASAQSRLIPLGSDALKSGPVLGADGSITWVASDASGARVMRASAAGPPRIIAHLPPSGAPEEVDAGMTYELAASTQIVAVRRFAQTCRDSHDCKYNYYDTRVAEVLVGVPDGQMTRLAGCGFAPGEPSCDGTCPWDAIPRLPLVSGPLLATGPDCVRADTLQIIGPDRTTQATLAVEGATDLTADDLLTTTADGRTVTLQRWRTGEIVTQITFPGRRLPSGVGIGPGSSIVYAGPDAAGDQRLWTVAAGAQPQPVGRLPRYSTLMSVADDRVLVDSSSGPRFTVRSLSGPQTIPVEAPNLTTSVEFDGTHVAYGSRPCLTSVVVVQPVDQQPPSELSRPCPIPRVVGAVRVGNVASVDLACPSDPLAGCAGALGVTLVARRTGPGAAGRHALPITTYSLAPAERGTVTLTLTPAARAFVRHADPRRVVVTAVPSAEVPSPPRRTTRPVVLAGAGRR